jgi:hypothetical protein
VEPAATGVNATGRAQGARTAFARTWECVVESWACVVSGSACCGGTWGCDDDDRSEPRVTVAVDCADSSNQSNSADTRTAPTAVLGTIRVVGGGVRSVGGDVLAGRYFRDVSGTCMTGESKTRTGKRYQVQSTGLGAGGRGSMLTHTV